MSEAPPNPHRDLRTVHSDLIQLAAELVRGDKLPSCFDEDNFYKSTPVAERRRVRKAIDDVAEQCKLWGIRLREIADRLPKHVCPDMQQQQEASMRASKEFGW